MRFEKPGKTPLAPEFEARAGPSDGDKLDRLTVGRIELIPFEAEAECQALSSFLAERIYEYNVEHTGYTDGKLLAGCVRSETGQSSLASTAILGAAAVSSRIFGFISATAAGVLERFCCALPKAKRSHAGVPKLSWRHTAFRQVDSTSVLATNNATSSRESRGGLLISFTPKTFGSGALSEPSRIPISDTVRVSKNGDA
jgi:hypothetical protein